MPLLTGFSIHKDYFEAASMPLFVIVFAAGEGNFLFEKPYKKLAV